MPPVASIKPQILYLLMGNSCTYMSGPYSHSVPDGKF